MAHSLGRSHATSARRSYGWSASPVRYDYLRQRDRLTSYEAQIHQDAAAHMQSGQPPVIRRLLERPFGSVRPSDNTPDEEVLP